MPERVSTPEVSPARPALPETERPPERFARPSETEPATAGERQTAAIPPGSTLPAPPMPPLEVDRLLKEVESILADGLDAAYAAMDPLTQKEFKEEGERAAQQIRSLLDETKVKIRKIIKILSKWLSFIPGVSKLFVEQEAKIKTDRLLAIRARERGGGSGR